MSEMLGAQLDEAHDALRAWCHDRPDLRDPSIVYRAFGSVTAIIATLEHIVDVASAAAARATSTDEGRAVVDASAEVRTCARAAVQLLDEAYRAIAEAHEISAHLIFAPVDHEAAAPTGGTDG